MRFNFKTAAISVLTLAVGGAASVAVSSLGGGIFWSSVASGIASAIGGYFNNAGILSTFGKSGQTS